jgi:hypothetical protein
VFIDREALKVDVPARAELGLNRAWDVDGTLQAHLGHTVFDDLKVDRDDTCHLDGAAERDLAITLREVQVTDRELGTRHMDG